jgi:uncharacterized membrane protein YcjF (UPF0283 family)
LLGLVLVAQTAAFYQTWQGLPLWGQWVTGLLFALCAVVVLYFMARLCWNFASLRRNRQVRLGTLQALQQRKQLQALAEQASQAAVKELRHYLSQYPEEAKVARQLGLSAAQYNGIKQGRRRVLETADTLPAGQWLSDFRQQFCVPLDKLAQQRVEAYARRAAIATAASPNPLMDQVIVVYVATAMMGDLLKLYQLRPSYGQSAVLLSQAIAQAYLAGVAEQATESGVDHLGDTLAQWWEPAGGTLMKGLSARTAEGGLHWLLVRRLGKAAIRLLQPIRQ